jgi:hypothetical protein
MNQRLLGEDEDFDVKELLGDYESPWRFVCRTNPDRIAVYFEDKFVGGEMGSDDGVLRKLIRAVETIRPFDPAKYVNLWDWMADNRVDYQSSRQRLDPGRRQNEDLDDDFDMKDLEGSFPPLSEVKFDARADFETDISYRREFRDDPEVVDWIHAQLSSGNEWAWASVTVTAKWTAPDGEIYVGNDYLGGCSYKSKADFIRNSDYYPQMKDDAYEDLQDTLQRAGLMEAAEEEDFDPNDMGGEGWSFGRWAFDFPADYPKDIDIYCEGNITATARVGNQSREDLARDLEAEIKQAEAREPFDRNHRFVGFWDWLHDRLI